MNFEVSKLLPANPELTCPWCGCTLSPQTHLIPKSRVLYRCPECGQLTNYSDIASAPSLYDAMPPAARARLRDWVIDRFIPADARNADAEDTYTLKHRYQILTEKYLYSGCLNGALIQLGFRPRDTLKTNWTFEMRWKKAGEETPASIRRDVCELNQICHKARRIFL